MSRNHNRFLAVSLVLSIGAAAVGWAFYLRERQHSESLAAQVDSMEPDVAAIRQYRESFGRENARIGRAKSDMHDIERAINQYYLEHGEWPHPGQLQVVSSNLQQGSQGLIDPWGNPYSHEIVVYTDEIDGSQKQRAIVYCQPLDPSKPRLRWPEK
jgi:hypothetical protein